MADDSIHNTNKKQDFVGDDFSPISFRCTTYKNSTINMIHKFIRRIKAVYINCSKGHC